MLHTVGFRRARRVRNNSQKILSYFLESFYEVEEAAYGAVRQSISVNFLRHLQLLLFKPLLSLRQREASWDWDSSGSVNILMSPCFAPVWFEVGCKCGTFDSFLASENSSVWGRSFVWGRSWFFSWRFFLEVWGNVRQVEAECSRSKFLAWGICGTCCTLMKTCFLILIFNYLKAFYLLLTV